ncbi:dipeptidase [Streptomyces sp. S.PB5]|uniref:dipeptidase n=1 Tax=Streptomyces sp. S.PB5 TaxID=3020844 RepID=UPI0025AF53E0|nr:dipeptidase [Streptomyces sp. S.PB5]MDN3029656.1 dipeptidase [Streptomyces sp. S.PB5]
MTQDPLAASITKMLPRARTELAELVAFRSVADEDVSPRSESEQAAEWIAGALSAEEFQDVRVIDMPDGWQSVYGHLPGPPDAPTVLLYAHFDVQPPLDEHAWTTPPFTLAERGGRWYGRGAADCKGAVLMHLLALRALKAHGGIPVNVKMIVDGSEEQGTGGLERCARDDPGLLAADAVLIGDAGNLRHGVPTVTTALRGITMVRVQVETLRADLHSGQFGGVAPDALTALLKIINSLVDEDGSARVDGLPEDGRWWGQEYPEGDFRTDAGLLDGVRLTGDGTVGDRLWARPSVGVMGIDCPAVGAATPTIHARARAALSLRIPPGQDAWTATELMIAHIEKHTPWGARVSVEPLGQAEPFRADPFGPAYRAMAAAMGTAYPGRTMHVAGFGGGIPLAGALAELCPRAEILLLGLNEPEARIHAVDESVSVEELRRLATAEAHFLRAYPAEAGC